MHWYERGVSYSSILQYTIPLLAFFFFSGKFSIFFWFFTFFGATHRFGATDHELVQCEIRFFFCWNYVIKRGVLFCGLVPCFGGYISCTVPNEVYDSSARNIFERGVFKCFVVWLPNSGLPIVH